MKEADLKKQVKQYLQLKQWFVFHVQQSALSYKGICDLIAIKDAKVLFIELKTEKGILSRWQQKFSDDICSHGGEYVVVRSLEDMMEAEQ
jgi:Holliday junction resolvase-like predicted endonuclease